MSTVTDRRRILGPPESQPLTFDALPEDQQSRLEINAVKEDDIEAQISRTFLRTGLITNANGSGYLELDGNIVSVSIYGPRPIRGVFTEKASLTVHLDDSTGLIDEYVNNRFCSYVENNFAPVINLGRYPKSGIDIFINVISVQDINRLYLKLLSLISDTTTLALVDAKIEIIDLVASAFDLKNNTIASFVKTSELVGIWCDSDGDLGSFPEIVKRLQKKSEVSKNALITYLLDLNTPK